jgi:aspartyl-tRNA(Asn)/glutamyl-tRNA(Gln) amidotransferase subunit C
MTRISPDEVREIAGLARLRLDEAEIDRLTHELDGILGYIETVKGLDTANVSPMTHAVPFDCPMRSDEVGQSLSIEQALQNAPRRHEGWFEVPRIVPGTGGA